MRMLLVERRCPTCGTGDLLERLFASRPDTGEPPAHSNGRRNEPGYLCASCESEFSLESDVVRVA